MAAVVHAGKHRRPRAPLNVSRIGDAIDEAKQDLAAFFVLVLLALIALTAGFALWQVTPVLGVVVVLAFAAGVVWGLHRMRRPSDE